MPTLHLGVIDQPYADPAPAGAGKRDKKGKRTGSATTGDVADILEAEYHIMEIFAEENWDAIQELLADSYAGTLETIMMGGGNGGDPYASATSKIEKLFKAWISEGKMEKLGYPGVPTQAALDGVNHRLKHPYRKSNPRRPSFRDTGLYQASFKSWTD